MIRVQITKDRDGEDGEDTQVDVWSEDASLDYSDGVWGLTNFRGQTGERIFADLEGVDVPQWVREIPGGKRGWPIVSEIEFKRVDR